MNGFKIISGIQTPSGNGARFSLIVAALERDAASDIIEYI
jgi:hypothetical protein